MVNYLESNRMYTFGRIFAGSGVHDNILKIRACIITVIERYVLNDITANNDWLDVFPLAKPISFSTRWNASCSFTAKCDLSFSILHIRQIFLPMPCPSYDFAFETESRKMDTCKTPVFIELIQIKVKCYSLLFYSFVVAQMENSQ